jgi:hypothetical protein
MILKLYIGAHKTATTHIQRLLACNRKILSDNKISLSIPSDIRPLWFPFITHYPTFIDNDAIKKIIETSPNSDIWIFAEENISGVSYDLKTTAGIYPNLATRLTAFQDMFPKAKLEIFFSTRSYDSYYASSYLEVVRNRGFLPFTDFYDENRYSNNSWYTVIKEVVRVIKKQTDITLWRYEDFPSTLPSVLKGMTNLEKNTIDEMISAYGTEKTRPSISQKTLNILEAIHPVHPQDKANQLLESLNIELPASIENGYFSPFNQNEIDQFKAQYKDDITKIKNTFPNINFLNSKI